MAVTFDAVGPSSSGHATGTSPSTWSHTATAGAAVIVIVVADQLTSSGQLTGVTYGGTSMTQIGNVNVNGDSNGFYYMYGLANVSGGAQTVSVSWTGTVDMVVTGSVSYNGAGTTFTTAFGTFHSNTGSPGVYTANPTLTFSSTASTSQMVFGLASGQNTNSGISGATQRFTNFNGSSGDCGSAAAGDVAGTSGSQTVTWTIAAGSWAVGGVEVLSGATSPVITTTSLPPARTGTSYSQTLGVSGGTSPYTWSVSSGSLPGWASLGSSTGIISGTPSSLASSTFTVTVTDSASNTGTQTLTLDMLVPGVLRTQAVPGIAEPGAAIPGQTQKTTVKLTASATAHASFGGTKTGKGSLTASATAAFTPNSGLPVITGIASASGNPGYFHDQFGKPRLVWGDAPWGLCGNVGRWSSGAWQSDYDTYLATRAGQGFNVIYTKPMGTTQSGNIDDEGGTFDSKYPFQGGNTTDGTSGANPSSGLTASYWARIDYMLASAQAKGITVFFNAIGYNSDFDGGPGPLAGKSSTEFQAYGAALGARYKNQPNIVWMQADDYFGGADSLLSAFLTGLRGAGDTHVITVENMAESTSRNTLDSSPSVCSWGTSNGQFNFTYSYNVTYYGIEKAYLESSPIPVIQGDGYFYQGGSSYDGGTGSFAHDRAFRQDAWHALSSGARGKINGSESIWQWASTAQSSASTDWWYVNNAGPIRTAIESLTNWQNLIPDTSSAFITAGRGTHASAFASGGGGGSYEIAFTDSYVTGSVTPAGDLAVIYFSHPTTITIDQTKLVSGYTASWVDPVTGTATSTATGSTYNATAQGNNSKGETDWVLVFQGPATVTHNGTLTTAVTAHAAFGGTKTGFSSLTSAATAHAAFTRTHTVFGSLSAHATAAVTAAGTKTAKGVLGAAAAAQAAFSRTHTVFGSLTSNATATLGAAGTKTGLGVLNSAASARAAFAGAVTRFGALTPNAAAQASFVRSHTAFGVLASRAAAAMSATGTKTAKGVLSTTATAQAVFTRTHTAFGSLSAHTAAAVSVTGTKTAKGVLGVAAAASAAFTQAHTVFGSLAARATAAVSVTGTKTAKGVLSTAASAQAAFAGTAIGHGAGVLTVRATAAILAAGTKTAQGALAAAASAQAAFANAHTVFGSFTSHIAAAVQAAGTKTAQGALSPAAGAQAAFSAVRSGAGTGALTAKITAAVSAAGTKAAQSALTAAATAQAVFSGIKSGQDTGALTAKVTAAMSAAGAKTAAGAVTVAAAARAAFTGTKSKLGVLAAQAGTAVSFSGTKAAQGMLNVRAAAQAAFRAVKSAKGSAVFSAVASFLPRGTGKEAVPKNLSGTVVVDYFRGLPVPIPNMGAIVTRIAKNGYAFVVSLVSGQAVTSGTLVSAVVSQADTGGTVTVVTVDGALRFQSGSN